MKQNSFTSKLASGLSSLSVATFMSLGASLAVVGSASAIGFGGLNDYSGASFIRVVGGSLLPGTENPNPENTVNGTTSDQIITGDTTAVIYGPENGTNSVSYIDWYLTPTAGDIEIKFSLTFESLDFNLLDDEARYFTVAGGYSNVNGTRIVDSGQIVVGDPPKVGDPPNPNPTSSTGVLTIPIAMGDTFVFRVLSNANDGGDVGILRINDFEVIPFDFAPTYGVIFVGTALGINEWRKKRQASKKDEAEEKL